MFFDVPFLYYSVTTNESKENFAIVFWCFSAMENIVAPSSPSNFSTKSIYWGILIFVCFDKSILISL